VNLIFVLRALAAQKNSDMSEEHHAVAQQNNQPFVQLAAWIK